MKAIIIGATSGIGRELAKQMANDGYVLGITGRRADLLDSLEKELPTECFKVDMDLMDIHAAEQKFQQLLARMDDVDIVVINAGTGSIDPTYPTANELETAAVNVVGFTMIANSAYHYFSEKGKGHIVGMSSIAALRGGPVASYNASKAYVSSYLEGLACRSYLQKKEIHITDIRPGFVDTAMAQGDGIFWLAPVDKAVRDILTAIRKKQQIAYITKRWWLVAFLLKRLPFTLYRKISG